MWRVTRYYLRVSETTVCRHPRRVAPAATQGLIPLRARLPPRSQRGMPCFRRISERNSAAGGGGVFFFLGGADGFSRVLQTFSFPFPGKWPGNNPPRRKHSS